MGQCEVGGGDSEAASGMIADFLCKVPHMKLGDFKNGRSTGLGYLTHWRVTGIEQPIWRRYADSKVINFRCRTPHLDLLCPLAFEQLRIGS